MCTLNGADNAMSTEEAPWIKRKINWRNSTTKFYWTSIKLLWLVTECIFSFLFVVLKYMHEACIVNKHLLYPIMYFEAFASEKLLNGSTKLIITCLFTASTRLLSHWYKISVARNHFHLPKIQYQHCSTAQFVGIHI